VDAHLLPLPHHLLPPQKDASARRYFTLRQHPLGACGKKAPPRFVFSKVVVILRDAVTAVWTKYQQQNGYPNGLYGDAITAFDWSAWETAALDILRNVSRGDGGSASLWSAEQSQTIDDLSPSSKLVVRLEDLIFSQVPLLSRYLVLSRGAVTFFVIGKAASALQHDRVRTSR
jgi:hypothetical protein